MYFAYSDVVLFANRVADMGVIFNHEPARIVKTNGEHPYAMYANAKVLEDDSRVYRAFVAHTGVSGPMLIETAKWYDSEAEAVDVMQAKIDALVPLSTGATAASADRLTTLADEPLAR